MLQQHLDHPLVAFAGCDLQRGPAFAVLRVDLRAVPKQQVGNPLVAFVGGGHQRSAAAAVLQVDLRAVP